MNSVATDWSRWATSNCPTVRIHMHINRPKNNERWWSKKKLKGRKTPQGNFTRKWLRVPRRQWLSSERTHPFFHKALEPNIRSIDLWTCWLVYYDTILCHSTCTNSGFPTNILDVVKTGQYECMHIWKEPNGFTTMACWHNSFDWLVTRIHVFGDTSAWT